MKPKQQRMLFLGIVLAGVGIATALALFAMRENIIYFYSPTQLTQGDYPKDRSLRVGGLVVEGSVHYFDQEKLNIRFDLTDTVENITVNYKGLLPDLFREGQGIVAIGSMNEDGSFSADDVLAKHDENYMPPEVADAIKTAQQGGQVVMPKSHRAPQYNDTTGQ